MLPILVNKNKAYPVTLLSGNQYEIAVCTDGKVKSVDIAIAGGVRVIDDQSMKEEKEIRSRPKELGHII